MCLEPFLSKGTKLHFEKWRKEQKRRGTFLFKKNLGGMELFKWEKISHKFGSSKIGEKFSAENELILRGTLLMKYYFTAEPNFVT